MRPRIICLSKNNQGVFRNSDANNIPKCCSISVMRFDGPLIFTNAGHFENEVIERVATKPELRYFIIDAIAINEIDATGQEMLHSLSSKRSMSMVFLSILNPMDLFPIFSIFSDVIFSS